MKGLINKGRFVSIPPFDKGGLGGICFRSANPLRSPFLKGEDKQYLCFVVVP